VSTHGPLPHALVPEGGRVAILRALPGLGDLLCVTPALRALRRARPDVEVTYIGLARSGPMIGRYRHLIDEFMACPGFPGLSDVPAEPRAVPGFLAAAQARRFDLAIQLHGSGTVTNLVAQLLGAARTAGHVAAGIARPDAETYLPWIEDTSEVRRSLRLMAHLGWPSDDERLEFPIASDAVAPTLPPAYVVVHPGASIAARRWTSTGFIEVARALASDGLSLVVTGSREEIERNRCIVDALGPAAIDLTGMTSLDELALVLGGTRMVIANDTGIAHLADALRVPSVVIFTGSSPARWASLDPVRHPAVPGSARRIIREARRVLADTAQGRPMDRAA
jgi:ADP-heptose:LPS heptosyltransferase